MGGRKLFEQVCGRPLAVDRQHQVVGQPQTELDRLPVHVEIAHLPLDGQRSDHSWPARREKRGWGYNEAQNFVSHLPGRTRLMLSRFFKIAREPQGEQHFPDFSPHLWWEGRHASAAVAATGRSWKSRIHRISGGYFKIRATLNILIFLGRRRSGVLEIAPFSATIKHTLLTQSWDSRQDPSLK